MKIQEKYTNNTGNVLFLKLSGGFTGVGFIICFITYIHSAIFLSMYQILHSGKGKQKMERGRRRREKEEDRYLSINQHGPSISPWKGNIDFI